MKTIKLFAVCCLTMCLFAACGGITVKGENGQTYESYQECCAAQDFVAAHQYLAKMENRKADDYKWRNAVREAKNYVFKQEVLYLMSQGTEEAKKRIIYLLKEEGNDDHVISMLIELAIDDDDEGFVKTLFNQRKEKFQSNYYESNRDDNLFDYLAAKKSDENADFIIGLLTEKESIITKKPQMGLVMFEYRSDAGDFEKGCERHIASVERFNGFCQKILGIAIKNKNQYLAQRVLSKFRPNIHVEDLGNIKSSRRRGETDYGYRVTVDNDEVNYAKATYQEAVKSGVFK